MSDVSCSYRTMSLASWQIVVDV